MARKLGRSVTPDPEPTIAAAETTIAAEETTIGAEAIFSALQRTDRACRLLVKQLRESHPDILESADFEDVHKLARRQMRENRELLGTGPSATA